jgi:hypothetical protein
MGMYNEVRKDCPRCGNQSEVQIPQVVLGFGDFNLNYPNDGDFKDLNTEQRIEFAYYVNNTTFYSPAEERGHSFSVDVRVGESVEGVIYI